MWSGERSTIYDVYVNVNRSGTPRAVSRRTVARTSAQALAALPLERLDLREHDRNVFPLLLEHCSARRQHFEKLYQLRAFAPADVVQVEKLADLGQRQPQPLAAQDELDSHPLALPVDARLPGAARRQQAFVLVEADRARRQREFLRELGDREGGRIWMRGHCRETEGRVRGRGQDTTRRAPGLARGVVAA